MRNVSCWWSCVRIFQNFAGKTLMARSDTSDLKWSVFPSINIPELFNNGHLNHYMVEQPSQMVLDDVEVYVDGDDTAKPLTKG